MQGKHSVRVWGSAAAFVAAGVALRLYDLRGPSLWFDEGGSLRATNQSTFSGMFSDLLHTAHGDRFQPLYFIALWCWRQLFGSGMLSLRLPSALLGIAAVVVLALAARLLYGTEAGLWCAFFSTPSALLIIHSQEARPYALLILLVAAQFACLLWVRGREARPSPASLWLFWVVTGVACFASVLAWLSTAALAAAEAAVDRDPRRWLRRWLPAFVATLPAIVFFLASGVAGAPSEAQVTRLGGSLLRNAAFAVYGMLVDTTYGPPIQRLQADHGLHVLAPYWPELLVFAVVSLGLVSAFVAAWRRPAADAGRRRTEAVLALALAGSFVLMIVFAAATKLNWQPRHSFFLVVPFALLVPALPAAWSERGAAWRGWGLYARLAVVALVALNCYSLVHYYFDPAYARDDYRGAAQYVVSHSGPQQPAVVLNGVIQLLEYYGARDMVDGTALDQTRLATAVEAVTHDSPHVLLVVNRQPAYWKQTGSVPAAIGSVYRLEGTRHLAYFDIYSLARRPLAAGPQ